MCSNNETAKDEKRRKGKVIESEGKRHDSYGVFSLGVSRNFFRWLINTQPATRIPTIRLFHFNSLIKIHFHYLLIFTFVFLTSLGTAHMSLIRQFAPEFRRFDNMMRRFENEFERSILPTSVLSGETVPAGAASLTPWRYPALDVVETPDAVEVHAELPGLKKEDIKLELHDRQLWISGESKQERDFDENQWKVRERSFGRFQRQVLLPKGVDENQISASFDNGVLNVKVAKLPESVKEKKAIQIQ